MKLSILICTVRSRIDEYLPKLLDRLLPQCTKDVQVLWLGDNKTMTVGEKRNKLLDLAMGEYVAFVDDDDMVSEDYIDVLLKGANTGADVFNFVVKCSVNGGEYLPVYYDARFSRNRNLPGKYERLPNHIMCIKRELALKAGFPHKSMSEDDEFAKRLHKYIKTQSFTGDVLYYYTFSHQTSETQ